MYTPVNPSFTIYKWGLMGYTLHGHVILMYMYGVFDNFTSKQVIYTSNCKEIIVNKRCFLRSAMFINTDLHEAMTSRAMKKLY